MPTYQGLYIHWYTLACSSCADPWCRIPVIKSCTMLDDVAFCLVLPCWRVLVVPNWKHEHKEQSHNTRKTHQVYETMTDETDMHIEQRNVWYTKHSRMTTAIDCFHMRMCSRENRGDVVFLHTICVCIWTRWYTLVCSSCADPCCCIPVIKSCIIFDGVVSPLFCTYILCTWLFNISAVLVLRLILVSYVYFLWMRCYVLVCRQVGQGGMRAVGWWDPGEMQYGVLQHSTTSLLSPIVTSLKHIPGQLKMLLKCYLPCSSSSNPFPAGGVDLLLQQRSPCSCSWLWCWPGLPPPTASGIRH